MYQRYTGIILKKYPLGEADELLTIFTKESGKLRAKAVSSRKIQSKMAGHLQTLNEIEFETAGRAALGSLPVLVSVRGITVNNYLRENLKKFAYALVGAETLYRLAADREENPRVYDALVWFLKRLDETNLENLALRRFQLRLLVIMGFGIDAQGLDLSETNAAELTTLLQGNVSPKLSAESEAAIDKFLDIVLERQIKSAKYLGSLTQNV